MSFNREIYPVFYHSKESREHYYHSTELRVMGLGAGGGKLLDEAELLNLYNVSKYIKALNEGRLPVQSGILLSQTQTFERFVLFRILYTNRKISNFRNIIERDFYKHFGIPIGKMYEKVIDDLLKMKLITLGDKEIIIPTEKLLKIFNMVQNGAPSLL